VQQAHELQTLVFERLHLHFLFVAEHAVGVAHDVVDRALIAG
jgi:hypothetical protein